MPDSNFYNALRQYLQTRKTSFTRQERQKLIRMAGNFTVRGNELFYTGPRRQYMRLVVPSEEQQRDVLEACHYNPVTGNHNGMRSTRDRVIAGYYWATINKDVADWLKSCHRCQQNNTVKSPAPHPLKVKGAWEVVRMDLIGPLKATARQNQYVLTMTDLYSNWVAAEALQTNAASEVSAAIISKLYLFGMVRKIISDQGRDFVTELNSRIFKTLNIKRAVSGGHHTQTIDHVKDASSYQNVQCVLRKYVSEEEVDWDVRLQAFVHTINTAEQRSAQHSPYYLLFNRHPRLPKGSNSCPPEEAFDEQDPEDDLQSTLEVRTTHVGQRNGCAQTKGKWPCSVEAADQLISEGARKHTFTPTLPSEELHRTADVSRVTPPFQLKGDVSTETEQRPAAAAFLLDHQYASSGPLGSECSECSGPPHNKQCA